MEQRHIPPRESDADRVSLADPSVSRRTFLRSGSAAALVASGILNLSKAQGQQKRPTASRETQEDHAAALRRKFLDAIQTLEGEGYLTLGAPDDGKGMLAPCAVVPQRWEVTPVCLTMTFAFPQRGGNASVLLPVPRDVGDQIHVASKIAVVTNGNRQIQKGVGARVVYSKLCKENPHANPFSITTIENAPAGTVDVRQISWLLMPVPPTQLANAQVLMQQTNRAPELAQRYGVPSLRHWFDPQSDPGMQSRIGQQSRLRTPADHIRFALEQGCSVAWSDHAGEYNSPKDVLAHGMRGDCGVKAAWAKLWGGGFVERAEGYDASPDSIQNFGGAHAFNLAGPPFFLFDPRGPSEAYVGPQNGRYIITTLGDYNVIPDYRINSPTSGVNGGYCWGTVSDLQLARLSTSTAGKYSAELKSSGLPREVSEYAQLRQKSRSMIYRMRD